MTDSDGPRSNANRIDRTDTTFVLHPYRVSGGRMLVAMVIFIGSIALAASPDAHWLVSVAGVGVAVAFAARWSVRMEVAAAGGELTITTHMLETSLFRHPITSRHERLSGLKCARVSSTMYGGHRLNLEMIDGTIAYLLKAGSRDELEAIAEWLNTILEEGSWERLGQDGGKA